MKIAAVFAAALVLASCQIAYDSERGWYDPTEGQTNVIDTSSPSLSSRVALFQVQVDRNLQHVFDATEVHAVWRAKFDALADMQTVGQSKVDKAQREEAEGKYIYFRIGDATRAHLRIHTKTAWKSLQGKPTQATLLVLTAQVGTRESKRTLTLEGRGLGFGGKVFPDSTFQQKLVDDELQRMAQDVRDLIWR